MSSSAINKGSSRPANSFHPHQRQTQPASSTSTSKFNNTKKRARDQDYIEEQPPRKKTSHPLFGVLNPTKGRILREVNGQFVSVEDIPNKNKKNQVDESNKLNNWAKSSLQDPASLKKAGANSEQAQRIKREVAENLARREKAFKNKQEADELAKCSNVSSASTATIRHETAKTKRAGPSSKTEVPKLAKNAEPAEKQPAKRKWRIMTGAQKREMEEKKKMEASTSDSITVAQKAEKRKIEVIELSSDDEELVQLPTARKRRMSKSERSDVKKAAPKKQQKHAGVEGKEKVQCARKTPKASEKKEEKIPKQDIKKEDNMTIADEPLCVTNEEIEAWFAEHFPQVSEVSEEISKVYLKEERDRMVREQARLDEEFKEFGKSAMQQIQQTVLDKSFRNNENKTYPKLHQGRVQKRKAADEAAFQELSKKARSDIYPPGFFHGVVDSGNTSPASLSSNTSAASNQTGRTTPDADPSDKDPNSVATSDSKPEYQATVFPISTFGTPPETPGLNWVTLNDLGQAPFNLKKTAEQIEKRKTDSNIQLDKADQEVTCYNKFVDTIPRRQQTAELKATFVQRKKMNKEAVDKAKITQERYHPTIKDVVFGKDVMRAWYNSDYRKENLHKNAEKHLPKHPPVDTLYVCTNCFAYTANLEEHAKHFRTCENAVPGKKVYEHGNAGVWSVWEVDGQTTGAFCQNLSLFARLFLADKTVSYYTDHFDYFLLVHTDPETGYQQIVGFFSKEKNSYDGNNLACILIFPLWQGMGLGKMLMGISYEISRMEGTIGGPERPFSSLGEKSYKRYWQAELARWILTHPTTDKKKGCGMVNIQRISRETCILERDCIDTINSMELGILPKYTGPDYGQPVVLDKEKVRQWVQNNKVNLDRVVDAKGFLKTFEKRRAVEEDEEDDD